MCVRPARRAQGGGLEGPQLACARLEVPGGPVFSLHRGIRTKVTDANVKPREPVLFCGLAAKEVVALRPDTLAFSEQVGARARLAGWLARWLSRLVMPPCMAPCRAAVRAACGRLGCAPALHAPCGVGCCCRCTSCTPPTTPHPHPPS
jgi:hypothetical protein